MEYTEFSREKYLRDRIRELERRDYEAQVYSLPVERLRQELEQVQAEDSDLIP